MENATCFATYNIFFEENPERIINIEFKDNVYLDYRKDPSLLHWKKKGNGSIVEFTSQPSEEKLNELLKEYEQPYQLLIYAEDESIAQNVSNLIHGGRLLAYPSIFDNPECTDVYDGFIEMFNKTKFTENILFACLVASRSWNDKPLIYSIEKFRFSLRLDSMTPHSASPYYLQVFSIEDRGYDYQVNAAYSIFSAYSIIEKLKLGISSSQKKPRFIEEEWNPKVKEDILKKLNAIGIQEKDTLDWVIRGEYTKMNQEIKPTLGNESKYYDGEIIFDRTLKILKQYIMQAIFVIFLLVISLTK
ncbi:hypothetical protein P4562_03850 [Lysinibacillus xylanilyticus]|uniref:hypothetical protein n=1 Tax=Lysinibacillus xylanilyticus TaxID=582475 RepID=UPI002E1EFDFF|nr:hypothetical protein [Lysinibacillus xylanilyticus]